MYPACSVPCSLYAFDGGGPRGMRECPARGPGVCTLPMRVLNMGLGTLRVRVTTTTAGSGDVVPLDGRKGLPCGVPSVAGVGRS